MNIYNKYKIVLSNKKAKKLDAVNNQLAGAIQSVRNALQTILSVRITGVYDLQTSSTCNFDNIQK